MSLNYHKVWKTMNDLEQVMSKILYAREIIDSATVLIEKNEYHRAEQLMNASREFVDYFIDEFDNKFKEAWNETVKKMKPQEETYKSWESFYYPEEYSNSVQYTDEELDTMCDQEKESKKWNIPVEIDGASGEYYLQLPDDLLDSLCWKEGDTLEYIDNENGTFSVKKCD